MSTPRPLRILYYGGGWPTNIGNAFVDFGAKAILRAAVPDCEILFSSFLPRWLFTHSVEPPKGSFRPRKQSRKAPAFTDNALDVTGLYRCDLVVFSGMRLACAFARFAGPALRALKERGVPILLMGIGAMQYGPTETREVSQFLRELQPMGFLSRDDRTYDLFAGAVANPHRGIDCAFFVSDYHRPFPVELPPYVVAAFDTRAEPQLELRGRRLIRAHHQCWRPLTRAEVSQPDTLISDLPEDYLALFSGAEEVHSDRVHACVAGLAYGNQARLYHETPRGSLFEPVGCGGIRDGLVRLDFDRLNEKKRAQIAWVANAIRTGARPLG